MVDDAKVRLQPLLCYDQALMKSFQQYLPHPVRLTAERPTASPATATVLTEVRLATPDNDSIHLIELDWQQNADQSRSTPVYEPDADEPELMRVGKGRITDEEFRQRRFRSRIRSVYNYSEDDGTQCAAVVVEVFFILDGKAKLREHRPPSFAV
jgi:hypothetical protein